jgi:pimeloyl-ACP methyl ester carboxylesterase
MKHFLLALTILANANFPVKDIFLRHNLAESIVHSSAGARRGLRLSYVRLTTGVRLHYAEQGSPNGEPVIMLHGYTDSWFSYSRVMRLLEPNYHLYILDQRGHGDSDRPATGYTFREFAADVIAFMDAKGLNEATVVGHSMGSFVAQQVAVTAPDRVKRLVLIGSATSVRNNEVLELEQAVSQLEDPVPARFVREFQLGTTYRSLPQQFLKRVIQESLKVPARVWREVMAGMLQSPSASAPLTAIRVPTLILWGDRETIFPRAEQDSLAAAIPNSVLKIYPETGHGLHWEQPEQFVRDFDEFMTRTH